MTKEEMKSCFEGSAHRVPPFVLAKQCRQQQNPFEGARWHVSYDEVEAEFIIASPAGRGATRRSPRGLAELLFDHKMLVDGEPAKKWFNSWFPASGVDSAIVEDLL